MKNKAGLLGFALSASLFMGAGTIALLAKETQEPTVESLSTSDEAYEGELAEHYQDPIAAKDIPAPTEDVKANESVFQPTEGQSDVTITESVTISKEAASVIEVGNMTVEAPQTEENQYTFIDLQGKTLHFADNTGLSIKTNTEIRNGTLDFSKATGITIEKDATLWLVDVIVKGNEGTISTADETGKEIQIEANTITLRDNSSLYTASTDSAQYLTKISGNRGVVLAGKNAAAHLQNTNIIIKLAIFS